MATEATLAELVVRIKGDASQLDRALSQLPSQTKQATTKMESAFLSLKGVVAGVFTAAYINSVIEYGAHLHDLSEQTHVSVEALSELSYAAKLSGTNIDTVAQTMRIMGRNISDAAQNTGPAIQALRDIHLNAQQLVELPLDKQMAAVADAMLKVRKDGDYMSIGMDIAGRSFGEVAGLFRQGATGITALRQEAHLLGITISSETADSMNDLNSKMATLKLRTESLSATLLQQLVPALTDVETGFTQLLNDAQNTSVIFNSLGVAADLVYTNVSKAAIALNSLSLHGKLTDEAKEQISSLNELQANIEEVAADNVAAGKAATDAAEAARKKAKPTGNLSRTSPDTVRDQQAVAKYIEQLQQKLELDKADENQKARLAAYYDIVNKGKERGIEISDKEKQQIYDLVDADQYQIEVLNKLRDTLSSTLTDVALHFHSAGDAAKKFFEDLAAQIIKAKISDPLAKSITGLIDTSGIGQSIAGFLGIGKRAGGGPVASGSPYLVGENGPEIFRPNASGSITSNNRLGGGSSVQVTQVFNMQPGLAETVGVAIRAAAPQIASMAQAGVFQALQAGGAESRIAGLRS